MSTLASNSTDAFYFMSETPSVKVLSFSFRGLTNLVELDLSYNALEAVPLFTMDDCKNLMKLSLRNNPIREIGPADFIDLSDLSSLDLAECSIEVIHEDAFRGFDNLEKLRLEGNMLTTLSPHKSFPTNLR
jgi:Leucine-rich repeat (LRR) protein